MRRNIVLPLLVCIAACSNLATEQQVQIQQVLEVACNVDGVVVPIAQPVVATLGSGGATVTNVDALLVHPAVVAACAAWGGVPATAAPATPTHAVPAPA